MVKIRFHTENQLPRLPGSALNVPGGGVVQDIWWMLRRICGGCCAGYVVPTYYHVKLQLMLRLSWAVTTVEGDRALHKLFPLSNLNLLV